MLTAYDYSTAKLQDEAGVDGILIGDSLGNVILGYEDTLSVTMEDMIHHSRAVARGASHALIVCDMPFLSYEVSVEDAVRNAGRLLKEGRANAVKLEGGREVCPQVRAIVAAGIPVMGHLGLTPQSVNAFGGFMVQGKPERSSTTPVRLKKPAPSPSCSNACPPPWPSLSPAASLFPPSASEPAQHAMGRFSSTRTCSA